MRFDGAVGALLSSRKLGSLSYWWERVWPTIEQLWGSSGQCERGISDVQPHLESDPVDLSNSVPQ